MRIARLILSLMFGASMGIAAGLFFAKGDTAMTFLCVGLVVGVFYITAWIVEVSN